MDLDESQVKAASILYEYEETKGELAKKTTELKRSTAVFTSLSNTLSAAPLFVFFDGEPIPPEFSNVVTVRMFKAGDFEIEKLRALLNGVRELELKLRRLAAERATYGFPVS